MSNTNVAEALSVLELRRYTLHPGRRDELIALFEREGWVTETAANNLPRLPAREGEPHAAWLTRAAAGLRLPRQPRVARLSFRRGDAVAPRAHPRSALRRRHLYESGHHD